MAGNIKIIEPKDNFQRVSKDIIFNEGVDALTLGVYVKVLCLGKKWELNIKGLATTLHLSEGKIKAIFALLEKEGYIKRIHIKDEKTGRFTGYDYHIGSIPFPEDERTDIVAECSSRKVSQPLENPAAGKSSPWTAQPLENTTPIYREYKEDKDLYTQIKNKIDTTCRFVKPSVDDVRAYCIERGNSVDAETFCDFYESKGWKVGTTPMKDWKAAVRTWERSRNGGKAAAAPKSSFEKMMDVGRELGFIGGPEL